MGTLAVLVWFAGDIPDPVASPVLQGVALLRELWEMFVSNSTEGKIAIIVLLIWQGIRPLLVELIFGARWREGLVRGRAVPVRPALLLEGLVRAEAVPDAPAHWPAPLRIPKSIDTRMIQSTLVAPEAFICPLSLDIMRQPAVTPRGTTYDRDALSRWVTAERRYPAGEAASPLRMDQLAPNLIVRNLIQAWLDEQKKGGGKANKGGGTHRKRRKAGS